MSDVQWSATPLPPPPPPAPGPHGNRPHRRLMGLVGAVALLVGIGIGYGIGHSSPSNGSKPAAAGTPTPAPTFSEPTVIPTELPSTAPESTPPPQLQPSDFKITLRIKSKECFGSAGCNITYQIHPTYEGVEDISHGTWDVTYEVTGGEDGPQINTFTLEDGQASFDSSELISTSSSSAKLRAKVTEVDAQGS